MVHPSEVGFTLPKFGTIWHDTSYPAINPKRPELSASGKSIVITGGGQGIGAATARSFAEAGAKHIAILGRTKKTLDNTAEPLRSTYPATKTHAYVADITDAASVEKVFSEFESAIGAKIDVLVSSASLWPETVAIQDASPDDFINDIQVNIRGPLNLAQAFLKHGKEDGVIVNQTYCKYV